MRTTALIISILVVHICLSADATGENARKKTSNRHGSKRPGKIGTSGKTNRRTSKRTNEQTGKLAIDVFTVDGNGVYQSRECELDRADGSLKTLSNVLDRCLTGRDNRQAIWRFYDIENDEKVQKEYDMEDEISVLYENMVSDSKTKVQLWQWKDVTLKLMFQRRDPNIFAGSETFTIRADFDRPLIYLWYLKYPGVNMDINDINAYIFRTPAAGQPEIADRKHEIAVNKREENLLFVLAFAHKFGEPLTLLMSEKVHECPVSGDPLNMDQELIKKMECGHRFHMDTWCKWSGPCGFCRRAEHCDDCGGELRAGQMSKFMCGHVIHSGGGSERCQVCPQFVFDVYLPSGERRYYTIQNRHRQDCVVTPTVVLNHFLKRAKFSQLSAKLLYGTDETQVIRMDANIVDAVQDLDEPIALKFESGIAVTIRHVAQFGTVSGSQEAMVRDNMTLTDVVAGLERNVEVYKMEQEARMRARRRLSRSEPLVGQLRGLRNAVVEIVHETQIPLIINNNNQHDCGQFINTVDRVVLVDVLRRCVHQINHRESGLSLPTTPDQWTYSMETRTGANNRDRPLRSDEAFAAGLIARLEFRLTNAAAAAVGSRRDKSSADKGGGKDRRPSGKSIHHAKSSEGTVPVDVVIRGRGGTGSAQTKRSVVPADEHIGSRELMARCLESLEQEDGFKLTPVAWKLILAKSGELYIEDGQSPITKLKANPGARLALNTTL